MRHRRVVIILAVLGAVLAYGSVYLWVPGHTAQGQQPLATLSEASFSEFEAAFDTASDGPRLVLLFSPT